MRNKKIATSALMIALAMILSFVESQIPSFFPIPGIKLGLANIAVIFALNYNKTNNDSYSDTEFTDSYGGVVGTTSAYSDNSYSEKTTYKSNNNNSYDEKTTVKSNDYNYSDIQYISDRTVDYDSTNKYHRVFFGLQNANGNYVSANNGIATIKIENSAGEVVYSKDVSFDSSAFTSWTNSYWDGDRILACIYVKDSELTKGSSDNGTLTISVVADDVSFDPTSMAIYYLPTKEITIHLPSTPKSFSDYDYNDNLEATIRVDEITYKSAVYDYDDVTVTVSFLTTMTYNSTPGVSKYVHIGYKLKNSKGVIVDSGTIGVSQSDTGDVSLTEKIFFDLNMKETYTLELSNSVD